MPRRCGRPTSASPWASPERSRPRSLGRRPPGRQLREHCRRRRRGPGRLREHPEVPDLHPDLEHPRAGAVSGLRLRAPAARPDGHPDSGGGSRHRSGASARPRRRTAGSAVMRRPPRRRAGRLLTAGLLVRAYVFLGSFQAIAAMAAFFFVLYGTGWEWGQTLPEGRHVPASHDRLPDRDRADAGRQRAPVPHAPVVDLLPAPVRQPADHRRHRRGGRDHLVIDYTASATRCSGRRRSVRGMAGGRCRSGSPCWRSRGRRHSRGGRVPPPRATIAERAVGESNASRALTSPSRLRCGLTVEGRQVRRLMASENPVTFFDLFEGTIRHLRRTTPYRAGKLWFCLVVLAVCWLIPGAAHAAAFVVNAPWDGVDVNPGDDVCETAAGTGICTLRAAVMEANRFARFNGGSYERARRNGSCSASLPREPTMRPPAISMSCADMTIVGALITSAPAMLQSWGLGRRAAGLRAAALHRAAPDAGRHNEVDSIVFASIVSTLDRQP